MKLSEERRKEIENKILLYFTKINEYEAYDNIVKSFIDIKEYSSNNLTKGQQIEFDDVLNKRASAKNEIELIKKVIDSQILETIDKDILRYKIFDGRTYLQISFMINYSKEGVRDRYHNLIKKLDRHL